MTDALEKEEFAVTFAIAEDEPLESEGMEAFILRSFPQASVIWRCEDGESALAAVHARAPDVLIVDIEMPVINGLQMCEILYRENYNGVILINTAYSKFSYAKKAISLKVFDYILKPMDNDELYAVLSACITEAVRRKQERVQKDRHQRMALEVSQYAFSLLAKTTIGWEETEKFFSIANGTSVENPQTCMVQFVSKLPFSPEEMQGLARKQEWLQDCGYLTASVYPSDSRLLVVIQVPEEMDGSRNYTLIWFFTVVCTQLAKNASVSVRMADLESCSQTLKTESAAESAGELTGKSFSVFPEQKSDAEGVLRDSISATYRRPDQIWERIEFPSRTWRRIRKKDMEKYRNTLDRYLRDRLIERIERLSERISAKYPDDPVPVLWETIQLYTETMLTLWPDAELDILAKTLTKPRADSWLSAYLDLSRQIPLPESEDAFASMQQWMNEAFATEVTLSSAAERMGLDTAYFSRLYKKKTGRNFSDDLTDIRMRHAENMLRENPGYSLEELCAACGFSSKTYFSEVFKRWKGMTITQFLKTLKT